MSTSLITGATGFIGQRLIHALDGKIKVLSRKQHPNHSTMVCDLSKEFILNIDLDDVSTVYYLAGIAHDTREGYRYADQYQKVNVDSMVKLANIATKSGVKKFIYISSIKAGGSSSDGKCIDEMSQYSPKDIYGISKREAELKLLKIGQESDMHVSIIRPSLVYGPNVKGNLQLMLSGINKGWFPPLPETGNKRSMIHVDDLVRAILLVSDDDRANGEIFIATDGTPHSSRDIYNSMCSVLGKLIPKWSVPKFLFDMVSLVNPSIKYKFNKLLGDECYSSSKLEALGFKAQKTLKDMNETDF
jgi:nucleoside-diphosphate-sugar epimerase